MNVQFPLGTINEYGVEIVGPYSVTRNYRVWPCKCPYCEQIYYPSTNSFKKTKSCYNCRGKVLRLSSEDISWRQLWLVVASRKKAKELGFDLTLDQFIDISSQPCYYCGAPPTPSKGHRKWATYVNINGLDRVDSRKGYLLDNVVPACKTCNVAKSDLTQEEFYQWIMRASEHVNGLCSLTLSHRI